MSDFFIDIGFSQMQKHAQVICGDVFLTRKVSEENRTIVVMSDGLGSGVKANILASMTASMALNFIAMNSPLAHTADIIMNTLPIDRERRISFSSFTIIDIESDGLVHIVEYGNPETICIRNGKPIELEKSEIKVENKYNLNQKLFHSNFKGQKEDRIVVCSDGVTQAGIGTAANPFGWSLKKTQRYVIDKIHQDPKISSYDLSKKILSKSLAIDSHKAKDDITAGTIYLREPRKLMLCSGPPYHEEKDGQLAFSLDNFAGKKVICGGTTANIIARELKRDIETNITRFSGALPPTSIIENIDLVTEGILTIGKAHKQLEEGFQYTPSPKDPATELCNMFLEHDEIYFTVGTKVNEAHQDPALPIELEIRRNVIKKIAQTLEDTYLKKTCIEYI